MFDWLKQKKPDPPAAAPTAPAGADSAPDSGIEWVKARVPVEDLIRRLKEPKDVIVRVTTAGNVRALCKTCSIEIQPAEKDGLLWLSCTGCKRVTFAVIANLASYIEYAVREGGVFESEVYYLKALPPGISPPGPA